MVKICPLTQHRVTSAAKCDKQDCVFCGIEGCSLAFAARMAVETHQAVQELGAEVEKLKIP